MPSNIDEYLTILYGDWKKLPPEKERLAKIHAKYFSTTEDYKSYLKDK